MPLTRVDTQLLSNGFTTDSTGLNTISSGNTKILATAAGTNRTLIFQNEVGTQATLGIGTTGGTGGTGNFYLQTNAGIALTIDSNSNVGIGTSSPSYKLHTYKSANESNIIFNQNASSGASAFTSIESVSNTVELPMRAYSTGFNAFSHAGIALAGWAEIFASTYAGAGPQGFLIGTDSASPMVFATNNAERMRINSNGKLLIANTGGFGNGGLLEIDANANGNNYNGINIRGGVSSYASVFYSTPGNFAYFTTNGGGSNGTITWNGSNTIYGSSSDQRLKENIVDAPSALNKINSVRIRSFNWIENKAEVDFGVIAQELVEVCPEAVHIPQKEEDSWNVDTAVLVPAIIKAIQELKSEFDAYKASHP